MISKNLITFKEPKSHVSEAYRILRTNIQYSSIDKKLQTILITSPGVSEGKSTTAANLAITIAQTGQKVLLMDCDLRKPRIHKYFKVSNTTGVTNAIIEGTELEQAVHNLMDLRNLQILTSGSIPPDPSELLGSNKMKDFLNKLKELYDIVIIDTPPVGQVTDAAVLGGIVDGVLLTIASGKTNIDAAKHAKDLLNNVNANILGAVLTKLDRNTGGSYYYNYYSYYYDEESKKIKKE